MRAQFWWPGMKRKIWKVVAQCLICQRVKVEHQVPIPEWKWDRVTMVFIVGFLRSQTGAGAFWAIVDRLTKSAIVCRYSLVGHWRD